MGKIKSKRATAWPESEAVAKQARELSSCLRQADEYFRASQEVGLATKPLLQFYCAQSLAKAIILAADPGIGLKDLQYHGLSTRPSNATEVVAKLLREYNDDPDGWQLEREYALTHDGVFPNLVTAAGDTVPEKGALLTFKELVRTIPDLADIYRQHYGEASHCFYLYGDPERDEQGHLSIFFSPCDYCDVVHVFPEFASGYQKATCHDHPGFRSVGEFASPPFARVVKGTLVGTYLVRPLLCGIHKPLSVLYAALFILSNLVRYKPAFWMTVIDGASTGSVCIAEAVCNIAERRFPNDVLEAIWNETFTYGVPAYYG